MAFVSVGVIVPALEVQLLIAGPVSGAVEAVDGDEGSLIQRGGRAQEAGAGFGLG